MSAILPATIPASAQLLLAVDPVAGPAGDPGFAAQFSALLVSLGPAETTPPAPPAAQAALPATALRALRTGRDGAASGKEGGKILPDAPVIIAALPGEESTTPEAADTMPALDTPAIDAKPDTSLPSPNAAPGGPVTAALAIGATPKPTAAAEPALAARNASRPVPAVAVRAAFPVASAAAASVTASNTPNPAVIPATPNPPAVPVQFAPPSQGGNTSPTGAAAPVAQPVPAAVPLLARIEMPLPATSAVPPAEPPRAVDTTGGATLPATGDAPAAAITAALPARKGAEPVPAGDAQVAEPATMPDAVAPAPTAPTAPAPAALAPATPAPAVAPQAHDFAALIDRLVEARQAVQSTLASQTVQASVQHAEFGRVSLNFQQDAAGVTVSFANPDPDLARAVQSLAAPAAATGTSGGPASDNAANTQRQDWQGSGSALSGQASQNPSPNAQQRGAAFEPNAVPASARRDRASDDATPAPAAPRNGIFA